METRTVDTTVLIRVAFGGIACTVATDFLRYTRSRIVGPLDVSIKQFYTKQIFHSMVRLDLLTFKESDVQGRFDSKSGYQNSLVASATVLALMDIATTVIRMLAQLLVLFTFLREQQDGPLLVILSFSQSIFNWYNTRPGMSSTRPGMSSSSGRSTFHVLSGCLSQACSWGCHHD